jgi:hypothetical protein
VVDADVLAGPLFKDDEVLLLSLTALLPFARIVLLETTAVEELSEADEEALNTAELVDSVLLIAEEVFTAPGLLREPDGLAPAELSNLVELTEDN